VDRRDPILPPPDRASTAPMSPALTQFETLRFQGLLLHGRVLARDHLQLVPDRISKAASVRARAGIRILESWLRRLLILMALALEPGLEPRPGEHVLTRDWREKPYKTARKPRFQIFRDAPEADFTALADPWRTRPEPVRGPVPAKRLLQRLSALKALLDDPAPRAKSLAWSLARHRPGVLVAPQGRAMPARWGAEPSALYTAMGFSISEASRARPPPLGPRPRAGPRIRRI